MFSTFLHQTLVDDLEGDTHGDFEDLLVALVTPPAVYDCQEVIRAIKVRLDWCIKTSCLQKFLHVSVWLSVQRNIKKLQFKESKYQFYMFNFIKKTYFPSDLFGFMPFYYIVV